MTTLKATIKKNTSALSVPKYGNALMLLMEEMVYQDKTDIIKKIEIENDFFNIELNCSAEQVEIFKTFINNNI